MLVLATHLAMDSVSTHWTLQTVLYTPDQVSTLAVRVRLLPGLLRTFGITWQLGQAGKNKVFNILSSRWVLRSEHNVKRTLELEWYFTWQPRRYIQERWIRTQLGLPESRQCQRCRCCLCGPQSPLSRWCSEDCNRPRQRLGLLSKWRVSRACWQCKIILGVPNKFTAKCKFSLIY